MSSPEKPTELKSPSALNSNDEALDSLGIVVGEIAHEFNNVLSLIFGYVEMALSELPEGERARSDLEHVLATRDHARDFVSRILTFSKSTKLQRKPIEVEGLLSKAIQFIQERLPQNIKLTTSLQPDDGRQITSNQMEIFKLVNNICSNSVQAMPEDGGEIMVSLDYINPGSEYHQQHSGLPAKSFARITIQDDGCGMAIDTLEKMYTPFFTTARGDGGGKRRAGLGLTTVSNIVSSHDGYIFVDSAPNIGTKMEICLPLVDSSGKDQGLVSGDAASKSRVVNILLVDDEPPILTMTEKMLSQHGYSVNSFSDGNAALEHFRQHPHEFDLIITDLVMPSISGTELAEKLSAVNPNVPVVLTTGFSENISDTACRRWGINAVINKPFTMNDLLNTIENQY